MPGTHYSFLEQLRAAPSSSEQLRAALCPLADSGAAQESIPSNYLIHELRLSRV